jgi:hypothetical protein
VTLNPKKSPLLFSALCGWGLLCVASLLPLWWVHWLPADGPRLFSKRIVPEPLWVVLSTLPSEVRESGHSPGGIAKRHSDNIKLGVGILAVGMVIGRLIHWRIWGRSHRENGT